MKPTQPKQVVNLTDLLTTTEAPRKEIAFLREYEADAMEYLEHDGEYQGVSTGYASIDQLLGSFLPGEVFTLGGDTGHGKSLLAMNIAQNVYKNTRRPVLFINLELTVEQAVQRFYNLSGDKHDYEGIMIQTSNDVNYKDVKKLMKEAKEENVVLIVVDHLHFFDDSIGDNAAAAITRIMKYFKKCAVLYNLPVLLLSHVTPTMKQDGSTHKPDLHGFKGSKSIEQVSDMVGFVHRDKTNTHKIEFYMRKNRSRPLDPESITLTQKGWKLEDDSTWAPKNLPPSGGY